MILKLHWHPAFFQLFLVLKSPAERALFSLPLQMGGLGICNFMISVSHCFLYPGSPLHHL